MFHDKTVADLHVQTDKMQHQCSLRVMFLLYISELVHVSLLNVHYLPTDFVALLFCAV